MTDINDRSLLTSPRPSGEVGPHGRKTGHVFWAVVECDLHIPQSRSLKEKRAAIRPIVDGIRHRFHLSVAEVGYQDKWQRSLIGLAVVSGTEAHAAEVLQNVERWIWSRPGIEVSSFDVHWSSSNEREHDDW